jgi:uncharacterized repeat protein (TIGR03803 family)
MKTCLAGPGLALFGVLIIATPMEAASLRFGVDVLHSFGSGTDGAVPYAAVVQATDGDFYGTTSSGGASGHGTVFKMTPGGAVSILHSFTGGAEGSSPLAALIQATNGTFYGTTSAGGAFGMGTVFTMTPAGAFATLYTFTGGADGANPVSAILQASDGNFYGTTQLGGTANRGTLFEITSAGTFTTLYTFTGGFDGAYPYAPLIQATDGSLYGTNYGGTISTFGRVFKLALSSSNLSVVHTFASGAADGANPTAALVQAKDGNFYGTTLFGGASNNGTAFRMTPDGTVTLLHAFTGGTDGESPYAPVIQAADGNLYGPTKVGASAFGTVYKLTLTGALTVVHTFTGGGEGANPWAPLVQASSGKLYGTASFGGAFGSGVVFRLPASPLGDFDGDGKADITVFRPSTGTWYELLSESNYTTAVGIQWGSSTDAPVPGDYDGDGKTDVAVFRPSNGTWYILYSSTGTAVGIPWGNGNDVPLSGDYDGDGRADITIFRPSNGTWYVLQSSTNYTTATALQWGDSLDKPVPGDYDGDGKTDIAVFRPSNGTWYIVYSSTGSAVGVQWGNGNDVPVAADYDGDGKTDIAVFRPSNGTWYIVYSSTGNAAGFQWGNGNDVPVAGDYDGDGKTDIAIFRPSNGTWYLWYSSTGTTAGFQWGNGNDVPVLKRP